MNNNELIDKIKNYIDNMYSQYDDALCEFHIDKYDLTDYLESLKTK